MNDGLCNVIKLQVLEANKHVELKDSIKFCKYLQAVQISQLKCFLCCIPFVYSNNSLIVIFPIIRTLDYQTSPGNRGSTVSALFCISKKKINQYLDMKGYTQSLNLTWQNGFI